MLYQGTNWEVETEFHHPKIAVTAGLQATELLCRYGSDENDDVAVGKAEGYQSGYLYLLDEDHNPTKAFEELGSMPELFKVIMHLAKVDVVPTFFYYHSLATGEYLKPHRDRYPDIQAFEQLTGCNLLSVKDPLTRDVTYIETMPGDRYRFYNPYLQRLRAMHKLENIGNNRRIAIGVSISHNPKININ